MIYSVAILAGGLATRLRPITKKIPKAMVLINGKPFIDYQLHYLKKQGIAPKFIRKILKLTYHKRLVPSVNVR